MRTLPYLMSIVVFIATNLKPNHAVASWSKAHTIVQIFKSTPADPTTENDQPADSLEEILKKDLHAEGAIQNILAGLALCYNALANLLLYPIFSFLLLALSLGAIVLAGLWIKKIKNERSISVTWILFTCFYFLFYLDLLLVVFQKRQVLFLFLELEKDLLLIIVAALIGYIVGKFFSSKFFEEKKLP